MHGGTPAREGGIVERSRAKTTACIDVGAMGETELKGSYFTLGGPTFERLGVNGQVKMRGHERLCSRPVVPAQGDVELIGWGEDTLRTGLSEEHNDWFMPVALRIHER